MNEHPSPALLRRLLKGTLTPSEDRRLVAHLLGCPKCRRLRPPAAASRSAARRRSAASRERSGTAALFAAIRAGTLRVAHLTAAQRRLLRGVPAVEMLLEASFSVRFDDPYQMLSWAQLARMEVDRISKRRHSAKLVADLGARTLADLANAYRVTADFSAAWEAMKESIRLLPLGTGDLLPVAHVARHTTVLLAFQRRFEEATELIDPLIQLYAQLGDRHLVGMTLVAKGVQVYLAFKFEEALRLILAGGELIDYEREPSMVACVLRNLLDLAVSCGRYRQVRLLLWRAQVMGLFGNNRQILLRNRWVEARIFAVRGENERAERAFLQARNGFIQSRLVFPASVCGLELAVLWASQGKGNQAEALIEELIPKFCDLGIARETLACLLLLREV